MYRARIDSVSGTKVYADGKWLFCIGNKNFRVGDSVWTDGRCAYGHFQEAQQPQVIIAPAPVDEGIPIYCTNYWKHYLHSFRNNELKKVAEIERPKDVPAGWSDTKLINDMRRVFTHKYLAANIDSHSNIFVMAEIIKTDDEYYYTEHKVAIFKDDKTKSELSFNKVKEIDLLELFDQYVVSKCAPVEIPFATTYINAGPGVTVEEAGAVGSTGDLTIRRAFIEDDNNFEILIYAGYGEVFDLNDLMCAHSGYEVYFLIKNDGIEILREVIDSGTRDGVTYWQPAMQPGNYPEGEYVHFMQGNIYDQSQWVDGEWVDPYYHTTESETNSQAKLSVGDGFYCTMHWERYPPALENNFLVAGGEFRYHFFSPDNIEIADIHADSRFKILFRKLKGNYLIIFNVALAIYQLFGIPINDEAIAGTFLFSSSSKQLKKLDDSTCSNDRLRPLKKIKNWHKHIKEIVLDLDDEKN